MWNKDFFFVCVSQKSKIVVIKKIYLELVITVI